MKSNLKDSLNKLSELNNSEIIEIPSGLYSPSFWVGLLCMKEKTGKKISLKTDNLKSFANTIGFTGLVEPKESFNINRTNKNKTYTLIQKIANFSDDVDKANSGIMSCLRSSVSNLSNLIEDINKYNIAKTIGELHDNVKSHSQSSGFSMAQYLNNKFEFSIADNGLGFLNELRSKNIQIFNDEEAIKWCLKKGNSTKKIDDEFSQAIPEDLIMNPMPVKSHSRNDGNYHQGLGLHILREFAKLNSGTLEIVSGESYFLMDSEGNEKYFLMDRKINGVSITLRLNLSEVETKMQKTSSTSEVLPSINWEIS